ncbi:MAG TPA: DinB family protein [Gemmatimonadaceae bacterium]|nr:DinB family protein [Gemmatimonadaceae bacterium]
MSIAEEFLARSRYWLTKEYPIKLRHCVEALPRQAVWSRPNQTSNSIGNLLVHLTGNVTEWILGGIGGRKITRYRAGEFAQTEGADAGELLDNLETVLHEAGTVLGDLTESDLERSVVIQDRETTVLSAVYHVVEHFSMHTGQIIFLTKMYAPGKIQFYEDAGGLARPTWHLGTSLDEAPH